MFRRSRSRPKEPMRPTRPRPFEKTFPALLSPLPEVSSVCQYTCSARSFQRPPKEIPRYCASATTDQFESVSSSSSMSRDTASLAGGPILPRARAAASLPTPSFNIAVSAATSEADGPISRSASAEASRILEFLSVSPLRIVPLAGAPRSVEPALPGAGRASHGEAHRGIHYRVVIAPPRRRRVSPRRRSSAR